MRWKRNVRVLGLAHGLLHPVHHTKVNLGFAEYFAGMLTDRRRWPDNIRLILHCPTCTVVAIWALLRGKAIHV